MSDGLVGKNLTIKYQNCSPVPDKDDEEQGDEVCESSLQNSQTGDSLRGEEGHSESLGRPED